jgi:hypothetical protein
VRLSGVILVPHRMRVGAAVEPLTLIVRATRPVEMESRGVVRLPRSHRPPAKPPYQPSSRIPTPDTKIAAPAKACV